MSARITIHCWSQLRLSVRNSDIKQDLDLEDEENVYIDADVDVRNEFTGILYRTSPRYEKDEFQLTCNGTKSVKDEVVRTIGGFIMHMDSATMKCEDNCNCFPFEEPTFLRPIKVRLDSNCCGGKFQSYGCHVNNGRMDAMTPCDPNGQKTDTHTWLTCEKSERGTEDCGKCK